MDVVMIKNAHLVRQLVDDESRTSPVDFRRNLELLEAMYQHARMLGVWEQGPDTLPIKLRLARALNV
jgi:hypothetical protein